MDLPQSGCKTKISNEDAPPKNPESETISESDLSPKMKLVMKKMRAFIRH